jgi:signal transduction histidine kinase
MNIFSFLTPIIYWVLIILWSFILIFYIRSLRIGMKKRELISILLTILAIDAFRTLFESIYFGAWYTSLEGILPKAFYAFLIRPEIVFIPKILNVIVAVIIIVILLYRWIPQETKEKERIDTLINKSTDDLRRSNDELQVEIHERKLAEDRLINSEEHLRQSQKMEAVGQLAGGVAHDFNNMLSGIMGCADILSHIIKDNPQAKEYADLILASSMQAAELTQKLLSFSRKGQVVKEPFDVHDSIRKVVAMLTRSIDKRIEIITNLKADKSVINSDQSQIQNAILNFAINARDAMPEGGKLIISTKNTSNFSSFQDIHNSETPDMYVEISVEDTGIGMPKDVQERVFEPFYTTKGLGKGTGLGLAVVYNTIMESKGYIDLTSEIDKGTKFNVYLPVNDVQNPINTADSTNQDEKIIKGSGTILVVDDERMVQIVIGDMLRSLGYEVISVVDELEAIAIYEENMRDIDLVILDIIMPKMNGKELFYALKNTNPEIKVLISSGYTQDTSANELIADGALGFIQKPFRLSELSYKVNEIIS